MSCPQLADSLNLDSWSVADFKVTTKSKQRYAPILASGKPAIFKLSPEPLLCPWGVGKFQDLDSGRIALDLILEDQDLIDTIEKVDNWIRKQGESLGPCKQEEKWAHLSKGKWAHLCKGNSKSGPP